MPRRGIQWQRASALPTHAWSVYTGLGVVCTLSLPGAVRPGCPVYMMRCHRTRLAERMAQALVFEAIRCPCCRLGGLWLRLVTLVFLLGSRPPPKLSGASGG